jgi:hypothetical protein
VHRLRRATPWRITSERDYDAASPRHDTTASAAAGGHPGGVNPRRRVRKAARGPSGSAS